MAGAALEKKIEYKFQNEKSTMPKQKKIGPQAWGIMMPCRPYGGTIFFVVITDDPIVDFKTRMINRRGKVLCP
jgi:hypothetical protein